MSQGLKVYNESGQVRLDTTMRLARYHSFFQGEVPDGGSQTHTVPGFVDDGTWAVLFEPRGGYGGTGASYEIPQDGQIKITTTGASSYYNTSIRYFVQIYRV